VQIEFFEERKVYLRRGSGWDVSKRDIYDVSSCMDVRRPVDVRLLVDVIELIYVI